MSVSNIERYKKDLESLITRGELLHQALYYEVDTETFKKQLMVQLADKAKADAYIKKLPNFKSTYQNWYSEAKALVRQLLPDRIDDFARLYEKPKSRRDITYENYCIEDALHGLTMRRGSEVLLGPSAAVTRLQQQVALVSAAKGRFESSLFDIRQLLQADIFDSELDAAKHLLANNFSRAAGALAGVVLEKHLGEVCSSHKVVIKKKNPAISDLNDALKDAVVIDTAQWRFIQHLGDIRNLCDHDKKVEPTVEKVQDLLDGVAKVTKTVF